MGKKQKRTEELLALIKVRAKATSEIARDLTAPIHMGIFNWIGIGCLSEALRKMDMLKQISLEDATMLGYIDEMVDLMLLRLFSYCHKIRGQSYWLDTVKEFREREFFKRHESEFFCFTHECAAYCRAPNAFFDYRPVGYTTDYTVPIFKSDFDAVQAGNPQCFSLDVHGSSVSFNSEKSVSNH